ncbi:MULTISPECIES: hypothetical protein [unclassified Streptomyces]|uniref:hypothetical protein n=1 Tax=unclassified Streptomyces TaxID=2593676 RepID=UPI000DBA266E|nr:MULTISPECIES: hypothetical protein [unclassified Streptomyces]MYT71342.1 hypothetical protein [Streptomyces sp. SID8367]RAJ82796.1 hypothetical protein K377_03846 [Streptomyces sp. PsTaAH-137]
MFVFVCAGCGAELTIPLSQVPLPIHARQKYGNGIQLPVLMRSGTFAVDPEPWGGPWRMWDEIDPSEAEARGIYAQVHALSDATPGASVIAPGDIRGTRLIPEERGSACCGVDGADGPNMACDACGLPVASRVDDCSLWQQVRLSSNAVHRVPVDGAQAVLVPWAELAERGEKTPPFEPIATWGGQLGSNHYWSWSPQWEAAAGQALAHLLVASQGQPVEVPDGLVADVFQRALDALIPAGSPRRRAVLAGPGRPCPDADVDILLVPLHPQTGGPWTPAGPTTSAYLVPLPLGVWLWLVSPQPYLPVPASGRMPKDVLRDDPLPQLSNALFRADRGTFQHILARLPAVRSPWLRTIAENLAQGALVEFL